MNIEERTQRIVHELRRRVNYPSTMLRTSQITVCRNSKSTGASEDTHLTDNENSPGALSLGRTKNDPSF